MKDIYTGIIIGIGLGMLISAGLIQIMLEPTEELGHKYVCQNTELLENGRYEFWDKPDGFPCGNNKECKAGACYLKENIN